MDFPSMISIGSNVILFIIYLGIFARKEDVSTLRATIAERYVSKDDIKELKDSVKSIDAKLDRLIEVDRKEKLTQHER